MKKKVVQVEDLTIEVVHGGQEGKKCLVFAHGLGGSLDQWTAQVAHFSRKYQLVAMSFQGHGDSSQPEEASYYDLSRYSHVANEVLKALGISSCTWIGNSMGGVIGLDLIATNPRLIDLIITNGTSPVVVYSPLTLKLMLWMDKLLMGLLGYQTYIKIAVKAVLKETEQRKKLKRIFLKASPKAVLHSHQSLGNYDYKKVISGMSTPYYILKTPKDKGINTLLKKEEKWLKDLGHVMIEEKSQGGHVVNLEIPETYNQWLEAVLTKEARHDT